MNYNNKNNIKNIIANMFLVIAMSLSLIGGAFLLAPQRNVRAAEVVNGKPDDIKFVAQVATGEATDYGGMGFQYLNSNFNYVNVKNVVYYADPSTNTLYTDATHNVTAQDVEWSAVTNTKVENLKKRINGSPVTYDIYENKFCIEYKNIRYYLQNGLLYTDLACTQTSSLLYETVYTIDGVGDTIPSKTTISGNLYYQIGNENQYIRVDRTDNRIINSMLGIVTETATITPKYICIFEDMQINSVLLGANRYISFDNGTTKYYVYDNKLYTAPVFTEIVDAELDDLIGEKVGDSYSGGVVFRNPNSIDVLYEISDETISAILDGQSQTFNKVYNVNGSNYYYVCLNGIDKNLYTISAPDTYAIKANLNDLTIIGNTTIDAKQYIITNFAYTNVSDINTTFTLGGIQYFMINSNICTMNTLLELATTNGFYTFSNHKRTFSVDTNTSYSKIVGTNTYYPIEIFGDTYYVKNSDSQLYIISNPTGTLQASVATPTGWTATVTSQNNLINVEIEYTAQYLMRYNALYEVNPISLTNRNSFICFNETYYYSNNYLYLNTDRTSDYLVQDFNYTCTIANVLIGGIYHNIEKESFQYIDIDGKTLFVNGTDLYTQIFIGQNVDGERLLSFREEDKVINDSFAYKVNSSKNLVTIFNGLQTSETIDTSDTLSDTYKGSVNFSEHKYYVTNSNVLIYLSSNGIQYDYSDINIDYTISFDNDGPEAMMLTAIYNFSQFDGTPDQAFINKTNYKFEKKLNNIYTLEAGSPTVNGKDVFYYYDTTDNTLNGLYYCLVANDYSTSNNLRIQLGDVSEVYSEYGRLRYITNKACSDYLVSDTDNDGSVDTVYFDDSINITGTEFTYNNLNLTISGNRLLINNSLDLSYKYMDYVCNSPVGQVSILSKFDSTTNSFTKASPYINTEYFEYVENLSNNSYDVIYRNGNTLSLYNGAVVDSSHVYTYNSIDNSASFNAYEIHVDYQPNNTYYDIQSNSGLSYKDFTYIDTSKNILDGDVAFLNNYLAKNALMNAKLSGSNIVSNVQSFYIGFNEQKGTGAVSNSGVHQLTVQAYLNNDYVMKYKDLTSSYYIDNATGKAYGVLLDINPIIEEEITYTNLNENVNVNHYWFNYFDLSSVHALIRYKGEENSSYVKEQITDASGLYTFVFQFTYINKGKSTQHIYTYSVYITESSKYIDYPTFNTQITNSNISDPTWNYYEVTRVDENNFAAYYFNNQTYDLPIYTYDASKYNVAYDVKYNIAQNFYTTNFSLVNAGKANEYGILDVYKNTILTDTYTLTLETIYDGLNPYHAVHYTKNGERFGSLCITPDGRFLLSLENFAYYNQHQFGDQPILNYLQQGRIIKNGARNTPASYYMPMVFDELGDYTIENKYIISSGSNDSTNNGSFRILNNKTQNIFFGEYNYSAFESATRQKLFNSEVLRFGYYEQEEFLFLSAYSNDLNGLIGNNTNNLNTISLKYYGIVSKFIKDKQETKFRQLSNYIYSDVTADKTLTSKLDEIILSHNGKILTDCNIPITNLQPIYFDYYGNFTYSQSFYYRYENCVYSIDANGSLSSVELKTDVVKPSVIEFTNKTTISAPGFYIMKIVYGPDAISATRDTQYFAFIIDNSAPNLTIYTYDGQTEDKEFISSTSFSQTSRYTNTPYLKANWPTPNYFQGDIELSWTRTSYDGLSILSRNDKYSKGSYIPTAEGRYTFTIKYGIDMSSYTSTYVIVDHTTPTGNMYVVNHNSSDGKYYTNASNLINNIFNTTAVFASTPVETSTSGAKVFARISAIGFNNYNNNGIQNKIIPNINKTAIESIKTNIELNADNILFGEYSTLDTSPRYNFFDISTMSHSVVNESEVLQTQLLGNSDQSLVYIIKLYDEAGNSNIYYYIFDKSLPFVVYQILPSNTMSALEGLVEHMDNNTTQTNTNIHWGNYKAIHIANDTNTGLFQGFKDAIISSYNLLNNNFGGMFFKEISESTNPSDPTSVETNLYLYVPIKTTEIASTLDIEKVSQDAVATTLYPNLASKATIFVSKTNDVNELNNKITTHNKTSNYSISLGKRTNTNRPSLNNQYYPNFFKGDKNYTFFVSDALGNTTAQMLTLNSSVASETFYLNGSTNLSNPTKQRAYNAEQLNVYYKNLEKENQAFYAKITYDYFSIDFEHFLTATKTDINVDTSNIYYNQYCYDVENGVVYRYDITGEDNKHFRRCIFNASDKTYSYDETAPFISYDELPDSAFFPGYPYVNASNNMSISTSSKIDNEYYLQSSTINSEDGLTKQGLYIFRRVYIRIADGIEISQSLIDSESDESLAILKDDYAVRYHAFYIDRNKIIDLTYNLSGDIDQINSIGDLLQIYLGKNLKQEQEALITAETIANYNTQNRIITNKLKVETNFTIDKYATINKLESGRRYQYRPDATETNKTFNELMEDLSRTTNEIIFGYNLSMNVSNKENVVLNNNIMIPELVQSVTKEITSLSGSKNKTNFTANASGEYSLYLTDSSAMAAFISGEYKENALPATSQHFAFNVNHERPRGLFITKEDDLFGSVKELAIRNRSKDNSTIEVTTFTSSNVENLSFTFSDSSNPYFASINPYEVKVYKDVNGIRTNLLLTSYNSNNDGTYVDGFSKSYTSNNSKITDVFQISGDSAPYTYTINIFDRYSPVALLSHWSEDATYVVEINYIGSNPNDYIVGQDNFYYSICKIHIDRKAPQENLKNLVSNDPNIDVYCKEKYNLSYSQLSSSTNPEIQSLYKELMTTYAFPIKVIENKNLLYYYKKEHPNTTLNDNNILITDISYADQVNTLYETYSTIFIHDFDDSVNIYSRMVGDQPSEYKYSVLPSEKEYQEGINGHLKFTEAAKEFTRHEYINEEFFNYSTVLKPGFYDNTDENKFFQNGYYEIIESDEAGNLTRYFVYISDNTTMEVNFTYINSDNDSRINYRDINGPINYNQPIEYYITHNGVRYYLSNHDTTYPDYKLYTKSDYTSENSDVYLEKCDFNEEIAYANYFHNNTNESIPISVTIENTTYNIQSYENRNSESLIYGKKLINQDLQNEQLNALSITGMHLMKKCLETPNSYDKYIFDDFYSINIYKVSGTNETLAMDPFVSDPYIKDGSGHNFMNNVIKEFNKFVSLNKNIYTYRFEIINRYSNIPFSIYVNLPDADLELEFETKINGNLLVTIPDSTIFNVKITSFSIFYYQDYAWRPLSQDINKKIIQTVNTLDKNMGLPSTTYELGPGQYRFFYMDNFQRSNTTYQIVGSDADSRPPEFSFINKYINTENTYTTSDKAVMLVDDSVWQVKVILKNAVEIYEDILNPTNITYYHLQTMGNSTLLCNYINGEYIPLYFNSSDGINGDISAEPTNYKIYYYMGKLFSNEECTNQIHFNNLYYHTKVNTSSRLIYTLGNPVENRKSYILNSFEKIDNYEIIVNWITETNANEFLRYYVNIDKTEPTLLLMTESGLLEAVDGQNYNKPFTITWQSNYKIISARIIQHVNGRRNEIILDPNGSYDVHTFAGYTLYLIDEIGNELMFNGKSGFSFNFVEIANEYFSIYVDGIYMLPSDYISTNTEDGKTIRYYYYQDKLNHNEEIIIETDQTKNIAYEFDNNSQLYKIKRNNIDYTICYVRIIPVVETNTITSFINNLVFTDKDDNETVYSFNNKNPIYIFERSQDCDNFQLSIFKNLYSTVKTEYVSYIGNRVYVDYYYNNTFVKTYVSDSWATIITKQNQDLTNNLFTIKCTSTGIHRFEFYDSVNNKANETIQVTLIKDIMFSVNDENPMDNRIYNGDVVLNIPETIYYQNVNIQATLNGRAIDTTTLRTGTKYTFSTSGIYEVNMVALNESTGVEYTSTYRFTIINPNVARMTFGFGNDCGFTISKVIKNNADITDQIRAESIDSMWLTSGKPDTVGSYTITLIGFDKLTNEYTPFTFKVRLNNEIPSINAVDFQFGTKTSKPVTIQYNPALIYSQVGESYIFITNNAGSDHTININSESPDGLLSFVINIEGKFNITIYDKDGNFITNYTFTKVAPLNSSAKFIIIIASILVISLVVIFIFLRRHTKFR